MKRFLFIALALVALISCSSSGYKIKGRIEGLPDGMEVTLNTVQDNGLVAQDSDVVKNGKFMLSGTTDSCQIGIITFEIEGQLHGCQLFLENGVIDLDCDLLEGTQHIVGTVNNDAFQAFFDRMYAMNTQSEELQDKIKITAATQGDTSDLIEQLRELENSYESVVLASIEENTDKLFGFQQLIENYSMFNPEKVLELIAGFEDNFGGNEALIMLKDAMESQVRIQIGQKYTDFEEGLLDRKKNALNGTLSLSSVIAKNKYVLLDFWASWCGPCMGEVPNLKAAYKKYKSKGFEIVSVSVDDDQDAWKKAISENGMDWIQLLDSDERESSASLVYGVRSIPSTFLIDSEGTIIERNLRGGELEEKLKELLGI